MGKAKTKPKRKTKTRKARAQGGRGRNTKGPRPAGRGKTSPPERKPESIRDVELRNLCERLEAARNVRAAADVPGLAQLLDRALEAIRRQQEAEIERKARAAARPSRPPSGEAAHEARLLAAISPDRDEAWRRLTFGCTGLAMKRVRREPSFACNGNSASVRERLLGAASLAELRALVVTIDTTHPRATVGPICINAGHLAELEKREGRKLPVVELKGIVAELEEHYLAAKTR